MRAMRSAAMALLLALVAATGSASADSYVWTDERGRIHMTDDLSQVPSNQRARAQQAAAAAESAAAARIVRPAAAPASHDTRSEEPRTTRTTRSRGAGRRFVFDVEPGANAIHVVAELDGGVRVPFILDTGATACTLPGWAVEKLGLQIDENTPRVNLVGIERNPISAPVVEIDRLVIGDLVVQDLSMHVLANMQEGLLGMPFLNRFKVTTDPTLGRLVLEEIALLPEPDPVQSRSEEEWRGEFAKRHKALAQVREALEKTPSHYTATREQLEARAAKIRASLDALEDEARRAGIPDAWRD